MRMRMVATLAAAAVLTVFLGRLVLSVIDGLNGKPTSTGGEPERAQADLERIRRGLVFYREQHGSYPSPIDGLGALIPEVFREEQIDPWGHRYRYELVNGAPRISTLGRDGRPGGAGDDADLSLDIR
jgi:general secretion pathway protein G